MQASLATFVTWTRVPDSGRVSSQMVQYQSRVLFIQPSPLRATHRCSSSAVKMGRQTSLTCKNIILTLTHGRLCGRTACSRRLAGAIVQSEREMTGSSSLAVLVKPTLTRYSITTRTIFNGGRHMDLVRHPRLAGATHACTKTRWASYSSLVALQKKSHQIETFTSSAWKESYGGPRRTSTNHQNFFREKNYNATPWPT